MPRIYRTAQIAYDLKFDGAPFVYSWPSGGKVASYTYDRGSAEQAEPHLAEFLNFVIKESGAKSISLIAHSMGNEVAAARAGADAPSGARKASSSVRSSWPRLTLIATSSRTSPARSPTSPRA